MYANANDYHQSGTREEKETHMCKGFIFSCIVILAALLINGFYYAWQDPITWFAIVLIGVEWLLFFCSYKNTSMCDVDGRTSKARSMRYCGYFLSLIAFGLDCWSIFELINQGDNE
eukprot:493970_1